MKTGIEKFENAMNPDVCDLLIKHLEDNLHNCFDMNHGNKQNVICKELIKQYHLPDHQYPKIPLRDQNSPL